MIFSNFCTFVNVCSEVRSPWWFAPFWVQLLTCYFHRKTYHTRGRINPSTNVLFLFFCIFLSFQQLTSILDLHSVGHKPAFCGTSFTFINYEIAKNTKKAGETCCGNKLKSWKKTFYFQIKTKPALWDSNNFDVKMTCTLPKGKKVTIKKSPREKFVTMKGFRL